MANVTGSENVDVLKGTTDEDTMSGLAGNDRLIGSAGEDRIDGGEGRDTVDYRGSETGIHVDLEIERQAVTPGLSYSSGDTLVDIENVMGSAHDDSITGNAKDNVFTGGAGADRLFDNSTTDHDRASYTTSSEAVDVDLRRTGQQFGGDAEGDRLHGIENLSGSAFNDRLIGDAGNNVINGGDGADFMDGGSGTEDIAEYTGSKAGIDVDLNRIVQHGGAAEGDQLIGFEGVYGSKYDDHIVGDAGDNFLTGNAGNDTIVGGGGFDRINAGEGNDTIEISSLSKVSGGAGFDTLIVNVTDYDRYESQSDGFKAVYQAWNHGDIQLSTSEYPYAYPSHTKYATGIERLEFYGSKHGDLAVGTDNDDKLIGNDGDDLLVGGRGADHLEGGAGNDTLYAGVQGLQNDIPNAGDYLDGGSGDDILNAGNSFAFIDGGEGDDLLRLTVTERDGGYIDVRTTGLQGQHIFNVEHFELYGAQGDDVLIGGRHADLLEGGDGNDLLRAGFSNDTLHGGNGDDMLYGEDGNDELTGGTGDDVLSGGAGGDYFIFNSIGGQGHDVITDFNGAEGDIIIVQRDLISTLHSFEDFMHAATQTENGVLVDLDGDGASTSSILIANASLEDLTPDNVHV
ncbi:type I secretion C-terminal target domain (VC_A0849 subclass) [Phyllobacterium sp. CL33Tsu]|uniref:calcium-binding protein n=1 Tax=Phyllobacterium sp. CL33Tsu TaxID=1798191 RepID=UPI0008DEF5A3|nr:calcium-binding protein [Phyllobacterium sp. CL33Tsu]SFJ33683.1 type I secretion C-terminal target domain (VC_A0849 subclass) [Phyllobacterium sp. CL33Tsu]